MLRGHIKGAASAIYSILYTARAEYKILPGCRYTAQGDKILTNVAGHISTCGLPSMIKKKTEGVGTELYSQPYQRLLW